MKGEMTIKELLGTVAVTAILVLLGALCTIASGYHFE